MSRTLAAPASAVFMLVGASAAGAGWSKASFKENATGHAYPTRMEVRGNEHVLLGAGAEKKRFLFLTFNVFSMGLYVEPGDARPKLEPWLEKPPSEVVDAAGVYRALEDNDVEKSMRMVVARDVTGDDLRDGFRDALIPRLKARPDSEAGLDALGRYMSFFEDRKLPDGTVLFFTCHSGGTLETRIAAEQQPSIESPALCWALVNTFLGEKPMSSDLKKDLVRNLPVAL